MPSGNMETRATRAARAAARSPDPRPGQGAAAAASPAGGAQRRTVRASSGPHLRVASKQIALFDTGGDFFEIVSHDDGSVSAVMADVCGNGPEAALVATSLRPVLRRALAQGRGPGMVLAVMNKWMVRQQAARLESEPGERRFTPDRFVTAVAVRIDARGRRIDVASAGHLGPFVRGRSGRVESLTFPAGVPLGMLPDEIYPVVTRDLRPEDAVVLATDGVTDALACDGDPLGERGLLGRLVWAPHAAAGICNALLREGAAPHDDATVVVLQLPLVPGAQRLPPLRLLVAAA
jgi:serine phosphatase RsbU (regulator of sigma subunit)